MRDSKAITSIKITRVIRVTAIPITVMIKPRLIFSINKKFELGRAAYPEPLLYTINRSATNNKLFNNNIQAIKQSESFRKRKPSLFNSVVLNIYKVVTGSPEIRSGEICFKKATFFEV